MRVLIRRPHTYFFLGEQYKDQGGVASSTPAGCVLGNGTHAPIPGIYILNPDGKVEESVGLTGEDAHKELLKLLEAR